MTRRDTRNAIDSAQLTLGLALGMLLPVAGNAAPRSDFCSQTAAALFDACNDGVKGDSLVQKAICINLADAQQRDDCIAEGTDAETEGAQLCADQRATRLDGCALLGEGRYDPSFAPALFDDPKHPTHPNPYFPLKVGDRWEYRSQTQLNTVEMVNATKLIAGVTCLVASDLVFEDGDLIEDTNDWYAAAKNGEVWYCGEEVKDFESFDGDDPRTPELVSIEGHFKAGREGDKPGIIFLAAPRRGDAYIEEASLSNAEDVTEILSTSYGFGSAPELDDRVPRGLAEQLCAGHDCVVTKNFSNLEPGIFARKYYARGIGVFLEVENGGEVSRLVSCNFDRRCRNLPAQ